MPLAEKNIYTYNTDCFSLSRTLNCGQCFRFNQTDGGFEITALGETVFTFQDNKTLIVKGSHKDESVWYNYFDLSRDYEAYDRLLCTDSRLRGASKSAKGIHILRQEPFETLCSFIISQNNNIPRIKGIIDRLCRLLGEDIDGVHFAFPSPQAIFDAGVDGLSPIRAGFRAKYLIDAAQKVLFGEVSLNIPEYISLDEARGELMKIKGVGEKVADCTLLFSMGRMDAFPKDVWIKRIMAQNFPDGLPAQLLPAAGIAQQYLYHAFRNSSE